MTSECASLQPKRVRRGIPTWYYCQFSGKEVDPIAKPCTMSGCRDYRERGEDTMAGDTKKRIAWDGPASDIIPGAEGTLRGWAAERVASGASMAGIAKTIGCTWGTLQNAIGKSVKKPVPKTRNEPSCACAEDMQPSVGYDTCWNCGARPTAPGCEWRGHPVCTQCFANNLREPQVMGTCCNCGGQCPADTMHPDGDTLECPDCYRKAHEPVPTCARCGKPRPDDDCPLCSTCFVEDAMKRAPLTQDADEYECGNCGAVLGDNEGQRCRACEPRQYDPADTRQAAEAYLRHLGLGDQECFGLGVWLAAWKARGAEE